MQIFQKIIPIKTMQPLLLYAEEKDPVFFDIETTGLSWRTSHTCILGFLQKKEQTWVLEQWLLDHPFAEKDMLIAFAEHLASCCTGKTVLVHFNGSTFDLPYLAHKYAFYHLDNPLVSVRARDLFRELSPFRKILPVSSMKQQALEALLMTGRTDRTDGKDFVRTYQDWLQSGEDALRNKLLCHNREDVLGLAKLLPLCALPSLLRKNYEVTHCEEIQAKTDTAPVLLLRLHLPYVLPFPLQYSDGSFSLSTVSEDLSQINLTVSGEQGSRKYFFSNFRDYYYLPEEDQAIHKSVAAYVDSAHKKRATASTCYVRKEGVFYPQREEIISPALRNTYRERNSWFTTASLLQAGSNGLMSYADHILHILFGKT